ncbi:polar amino acid ABC transporter permease [Methylobacterium variabile]|jgi:general L-amino acid transport system permease protein|uniref:Polar amino acid ABC transporter permease n=1 Tax=Methylobacterium variabile TaxID=298794 RepID=A0A0J6VD45_9HYPH|nr:amino acid ABC transporter permease [Methylobacterium variabile]KMO36991.1 polar amino acid ABC transporter permease [Methylobacterium variabile]
MTAWPLRWARRNLFATPLDGALSLLVIPTGLWLIYALAVWACRDAQWSVLGDSMRVMMVGVYPADALWRAWTAAVILAALAGATVGLVVKDDPFALLGGAALGILVCASLLAGRDLADAGWAAVACLAAAAGWLAMAKLPATRRALPLAWLLGFALAGGIFAGPGFDAWGGLLLSIILTIAVSALTLPLGILLALGRQSRIASLRICCTAYIEVFRAVPLILVVYWVWIVVPLLLPDLSVSGVVRGVVGYTVFFCAYVAEYVRSGLQAVPRGQVEAARSLGMGTWTLNTQVVLPQAIKVVIPALVGNMLDIFNAATLVFIIGLTDFLRAGQMILADPRFGNLTYEVYAFLFLVYFAIGSLITFTARSLEGSLATGR